MIEFISILWHRNVLVAKFRGPFGIPIYRTWRELWETIYGMARIGYVATEAEKALTMLRYVTWLHDPEATWPDAPVLYHAMIGKSFSYQGPYSVGNLWWDDITIGVDFATGPDHTVEHWGQSQVAGPAYVEAQRQKNEAAKRRSEKLMTAFIDIKYDGRAH